MHVEARRIMSSRLTSGNIVSGHVSCLLIDVNTIAFKLLSYFALSLAFSHTFHIVNHSLIHPRLIPGDNETANEHENARFKEMLRMRTRRDCTANILRPAHPSLNLGQGPGKVREKLRKN